MTKLRSSILSKMQKCEMKTLTVSGAVKSYGTRAVISFTLPGNITLQ